MKIVLSILLFIALAVAAWLKYQHDKYDTLHFYNSVLSTSKELQLKDSTSLLMLHYLRSPDFVRIIDSRNFDSLLSNTPPSDTLHIMLIVATYPAFHSDNKNIMSHLEVSDMILMNNVLLLDARGCGKRYCLIQLLYGAYLFASAGDELRDVKGLQYLGKVITNSFGLKAEVDSATVMIREQIKSNEQLGPDSAVLKCFMDKLPVRKQKEMDFYVQNLWFACAFQALGSNDKKTALLRSFAN